MMPLQPTWPDIFVRLLLTLLAGALLGFNRQERGCAAGLRTTVLVTFAASIAMIQANLLLPLEGKTSGSFAVMDLMRLPLGILTGVGFLGGGAILKKGGTITGVTTAATLWIATVIGLCFGGGQEALGVISTLLGLATLWGMQWIDQRIPREHGATLIVTTQAVAPMPQIDDLLAPFGYRIRLRKQERSLNAQNEEQIETQFDLAWKQLESRPPALEFLPAVSRKYRVKSFEIGRGAER